MLYRSLTVLTSISHRRSRRFWRRVSPVVILCFAFSFTLGPALPALANQPPPEPDAGHTRPLSAAEMRAIVGAQTTEPPVSPDSGPAYPWEGSVGDVVTATGNKRTQVPLVGWTARGGLPVQFTSIRSLTSRIPELSAPPSNSSTMRVETSTSQTSSR